MSNSFTNQVLAQIALWTEAEKLRARRPRPAQEARREGRRAAPRASSASSSPSSPRRRPTTSACRSKARSSRSTTATNAALTVLGPPKTGGGAPSACSGGVGAKPPVTRPARTSNGEADQFSPAPSGAPDTATFARRKSTCGGRFRYLFLAFSFFLACFSLVVILGLLFFLGFSWPFAMGHAPSLEHERLYLRLIPRHLPFGKGVRERMLDSRSMRPERLLSSRERRGEARRQPP